MEEKKTNKKTGFENLLAKWQTDKIPKIKKKKNLDRFTNTSTFCCCRKKKKVSKSLFEGMNGEKSFPPIFYTPRARHVGYYYYNSLRAFSSLLLVACHLHAACLCMYIREHVHLGATLFLSFLFHWSST